MNLAVSSVLGGILGVALPLLSNGPPKALAASSLKAQAAASGPGPGCLHVHNEFAFVANAPIDVAAPLFGAEKERVWAPGWDPEFVWPANAIDQEGMVFTRAHGEKTAVWVNTSFDLSSNRIQYVYFVPGTLVTVITIKLAPVRNATRVTVAYDRTALDVSANGLVQEMAERDADAGPEWEGQINGYLKARP